MKKISPILLEIFKNRFSSIAEEMGIILQKSSYSVNIKERKDFSCGIFDKKGRLIAQAEHIPVHLGSMPMSVQKAIKEIKFEEGDIVILNDPYKGGTHLPDITLISPVFIKNSLEYFVANRAHHSDIGGITAGSMPISTSIFQEGIIIPPVKLVEKGKLNNTIFKLLLNNTRTPYEREGDFKAQIASNNIGIERVKELIKEYDLKTSKTYQNALIKYTQTIIESIIKKIPNGTYHFEDYMEDDGHLSENIKISLSLKIEESQAILDFSKSSPQVKGSINAVHSITLSSVIYVFRALAQKDIPTNDGCFRPIKVITKKNTITDAQFPSAVAGGNVETSQRIVDVVLGALFKAIPEHIPAASQGTMNNLSIGGINPENNQPFSYYETIGGGLGASLKGDGESAIQSHMTNTLNTPIEAVEFEYPFLITQYSIRKNSGGNGLHKGGDGIIKEIQFLTDVEVTILSERRRIAPYGLAGGEPAKVGRNYKIFKNNRKKTLPSKIHLTLKKGEKIRIETPGGGGYGKPTQ
ncbi:MAG: hydantoinase B/oxoprolinase family protein [Aquificae bacterium]|nr:hydantoinase B/oxoprolinase family protein [Aquificota bacterium]